MSASRKPMHVDATFEKRLKDLQKKIMMKQGVKPSLRELTAKLPKFKAFGDIEEELIKDIEDIDEIKININFDRSRK